ncbi:MAG: hypothetical protein KBT14_03020 [Proteobacteria bacterium]|nr:hypothetical protein [Candidatus Enterousia onthequi]
MKKLFLFIFAICITNNVYGYQKISSNELGMGDARNQNIVVKCTTPGGQISNETCALRRYAKCTNNNCASWDVWRDLRNTTATYTTWQDAADACCRAKGLR